MIEDLVVENRHDHDFTTIVCLHCGKEIVVPVYCGNRFCPICSKPRLARVRRRIEFLIKNTEKENGRSFKHLTLTLRSQPDLPGMLKYLTRSFRKMRNTKLWKRFVSGGAFVIEVTHSDAGYHAHIHSIIYADYIEFNELLRMWVKCSGSRGVYIKRIPEHQIVRYLTKYISKPTDDQAIEDAVHRSLQGFRLFQPFGTWYNLSKKFIDVRPGCPDCGGSSFLPTDILYREIHQKYGWSGGP